MLTEFTRNTFRLKPEFTDEQKRLRPYPRVSEDGWREISNDADGNRLMGILREDLKWTKWNGLPEPNIFKKPVPPCPFPGFEPRPHQLEAISNILTFKHHAIFMDMGLGKTFTSLFCAAHWVSKGQASRFLVVAPKRVIPEWVRQCRRFQAQLATKILVPIILGDDMSQDERANMLRLTQNIKGVVYVTNYEALRKGSPLYYAIKGNADPDKGPVVEPITFDACFADESVRIRNTSTQASIGLRELSRFFKRRYVLSGLPAPQTFSDYVGQIAFLHPVYMGYNTKEVFEKDWGVRSFYTGKIESYTNIEHWHKRIHTMGTVIRKKDAGINLPDKIYAPKHLDMAPDQQKAYDAMADQFVAWVEDYKSQGNPIEVMAPNVLAKLTRLRQITNGWLCGATDKEALKNQSWFNETEGDIPKLPPIPFSSNPKLEMLEELLDEVEFPFVVVAAYTHEIEAIQNLIMEQGKACEKIAGDVSTKRQMEIQDDFDAGLIDVMVIQSDSGKYGLNLQRAHTIVFFSNSFSLDSRAQSEDRVHRDGQTEKVTVVDLIVEGSVDEKIMEALETKRSLAHIILENPSCVRREDYAKAGY